MSRSPAETARPLALRVLRRVVEDGAYSNLTLAAELRRTALEPRERRLAAELVYGTLRRTVSLDWALAQHTSRPLGRVTPAAMAVLRLGAYQLLFTRIPDHAAIGETVGLAGPRERGFCNGVLRSLARRRPRWPAGDDDRAVSVRTGVAEWIVRELRRLLGGETEAAAAALAERAPVTLRTNTCRTTVDDLEGALRSGGLEPRRGALHPDSLLLDDMAAGGPAELPGFRDGLFAVQDQASSFVVRALEPRPGERILDACAGPGGKAGHVACLVEPGGFTVAADVSPARAHLVAEQAARLGVKAAILVQDARAPALRGPFGAILVDAPCSGIGSARRRPELLWRPRRQDLSSLARLQVAIVSGIAELLEPGGRLVYSVCTFPRAETDAACDAILRHRPDLEPEPLDGPGGPAERIRLWPHRHGCDAMFVAGFCRRA